MSWDGAVFRSKSGSYASFDPADIEPISVEQVYEAICAEFPGTDTSDLPIYWYLITIVLLLYFL